MLLNDADPNDPKTRMLEKIEQQTFRAAASSMASSICRDSTGATGGEQDRSI
jgi:hypothetical protein